MLRTRIVTAIVLLAGLLAALFWLPETGWVVLVGALLAAAAWEWAALARIRAVGRIAYTGAIAAAGLWAGWNTGIEIHSGFTWLYIIAIVYWVVLAPLWLWERPAFGNPVMPLAAGAAVLIPSAVAMVELRNASPDLLLAIMAIVWISDIAAYFCGRRFGREKLAPSISPAKTWEGVYGSAAAVTIYALSWLGFGGRRPEALWHAPLGALWFVLMLLALASAGIVGDLLESQMKRQAGVKDSGRLLPGHGGVLDRIDALLPVLPLAALAYLR